MLNHVCMLEHFGEIHEQLNEKKNKSVVSRLNLHSVAANSYTNNCFVQNSH